MTSPGPRQLVISPGYPPPFIGGAKVYLFNLVEHSPVSFDILTSALKEGCHEVSSPRHDIFRSKYIYDSNTKDPTSIDLLISYGYILWWLWRRRARVKYDAVVVNALTFGNGLVFLLLKYLKVPVIGVVYGEEFTQVFKGRGLKNFIKRQFIRLAQKKATGFITVCHFGKEVLMSLGIDGEKVDVVPCSININKLASTRSRTRRAGHKILSVGRLIERKGFQCLIDAVSRLKDEFPNIQLTIVGNGPYRPVLVQKVKERGLEDCVFIRGDVKDDELAQLYRDSDLFVLAHMMLDNGDTEGCPTVYAEASGCGLPVIGGTGGGAATIIEEGKTGYIVDARNIEALAQRIRQVLRDPELAHRLGAAGLEKVRRDHVPEKTGREFYASICRLTRHPERAARGSAAGPTAVSPSSRGQA